MASYHNCKGKRMFVSRTIRYRLRKEKELSIGRSGVAEGVADDYDFNFNFATAVHPRNL